MELSESEYKILNRYRTTTMEGDNDTKVVPKNEYLCFGGTGKIDRSAKCVFELLYDGDNCDEKQKGQDQQKEQIIDPREGLERILGNTYHQQPQHKVVDESFQHKTYSSLLGDCPLRTIQRNTEVVQNKQSFTLEQTNQLEKRQEFKVLRDISSLEHRSEDSVDQVDQEGLFDLSEQQVISQQNLEEMTLDWQKQQQQQQEKLNRARQTDLSRMIEEFNKSSRIQIAGIKHFEGKVQKMQDNTQNFLKIHNLPHFQDQYQHNSLTNGYSCVVQNKPENHEGQLNINRYSIQDKENQQTDNLNNYCNNYSSYETINKPIESKRLLSKGRQLEEPTKQLKGQKNTTTAITTLSQKSDENVNLKQSQQHPLGYLEKNNSKQQTRQLECRLPSNNSRIPKKKTDSNNPIKKNRCQSGNFKQNNSTCQVIVSSVKGHIMKDKGKTINSSTRL